MRLLGHKHCSSFDPLPLFGAAAPVTIKHIYAALDIDRIYVLPLALCTCLALEYRYRCV